MGKTSACELFRRCLDGRSDAEWREFLCRFGPQIRRALAAALKRHGAQVAPTDLEDLFQDLCCRLLTAGGRRFRGRSEGELWAYLHLVVRSILLDRRRDSRTARRQVELVSMETGGRDEPSREASPEERCLLAEGRRLLLARCRQVGRGRPGTTVLRLALLEGWTSREIAERSDGAFTPGQVDTLVYRLRQRLARDGIHLPRRYRGL